MVHLSSCIKKIIEIDKQHSCCIKTQHSCCIKTQHSCCNKTQHSCCINKIKEVEEQQSWYIKSKAVIRTLDRQHSHLRCSFHPETACKFDPPAAGRTCLGDSLIMNTKRRASASPGKFSCPKYHRFVHSLCRLITSKHKHDGETF